MAGNPSDDDLGPDIDDADLESLRNAFVEAYNARDLDAILQLVSDDVETPDLNGDGPETLVEELLEIWARSPGAILTHAAVDNAPAAVMWTPDEYGRWCRSGLVTFDDDRGRLTVVEIPDDDAAMQLAMADDPTGDLLDEELDWAEWDSGEPTRDGDGDWYERQLPDFGAG